VSLQNVIKSTTSSQGEEHRLKTSAIVQIFLKAENEVETNYYYCEETKKKALKNCIK
jgi:hypothetical protein